MTKLVIFLSCTILANSLAAATQPMTALVPLDQARSTPVGSTMIPAPSFAPPTATTATKATPAVANNFPPGTQVNFNVNFAQNTETHNVTKSTANASTEATSSARQETPLLNGLNDLLAQIPDAKKLGHDVHSHMQDFFITYKWRLFALGTAAAYAFLCYYLYMGNLYLANTQLWSSWRQEIPLQQLLAIPQQQHAQELIREIRLRYTTADNLDNTIQPLALFMNAVAHEEERLLSYQKVFSWLAYTRLAKITPISTTKLETIPDRLARLAYYKNLFQSWVTTHHSDTITKHVRSKLQRIADSDYRRRSTPFPPLLYLALRMLSFSKI
jgi:hypothetical protein